MHTATLNEVESPTGSSTSHLWIKVALLAVLVLLPIEILFKPVERATGPSSP